MTKEKVKKYSIHLLKVLNEKKAKDILMFDIEKYNPLVDYAIIATGDSFPHQQALSRFILEQFSQFKIKPLNVIDKNNPWVLIDFNFIVVHLFLKEARIFYSLEKLWPNSVFNFNLVN